MSDSASFLEIINRVCDEFATALQHSQAQIFTMIALVILLTVLLFPPKDDPDQI